jgi:hypothetical protein
LQRARAGAHVLTSRLTRYDWLADHVREIQPRSHGDCDVVLHDGTQLRLSRSFRDNVLTHGL